MNKLSELLHSEMQTLNKNQKTQFKRELTEILIVAVRMASDEAKKAAETAPVTATQENARKK